MMVVIQYSQFWISVLFSMLSVTLTVISSCGIARRLNNTEEFMQCSYFSVLILSLTFSLAFTFMYTFSMMSEYSFYVDLFSIFLLIFSIIGVLAFILHGYFCRLERLQGACCNPQTFGRITPNCVRKQNILQLAEQVRRRVHTDKIVGPFDCISICEIKCLQARLYDERDDSSEISIELSTSETEEHEDSSEVSAELSSSEMELPYLDRRALLNQRSLEKFHANFV